MGRGRYETLIEPDLWDYIDEIDGWYPPGAATLPMDEQRAIYDEMCRALHPGRPADVDVTDAAIALADRSIPIRFYRKAASVPGALVLYYHGGGFVLGGLDSHDDVCADLCAETGYEVVSVDYRLAPEHVHPAAFEDALAAFEWATAMPQPIVLCGESAGGTLAAAVAHATRGWPVEAIGQVLIYPALGGDETAGSYVEHANAPLLTMGDLELYRRLRLGDADTTDDPTIDPLRDTDFDGLPPTVIITAEFDPLSSDGEAYRDRIGAAGGCAAWIEEPRLVHSFLRARKSVPRAQQAFGHIVDAVATLGRSEWTYGQS